MSSCAAEGAKALKSDLIYLKPHSNWEDKRPDSTSDLEGLSLTSNLERMNNQRVNGKQDV